MVPLISWTEFGLYCEAGDFYIDPHKTVLTAVITHAHSDHARRGCQTYICEKTGLGLLKSRLGQKIQVRTFCYGEPFQLGGVRVSLHSAGHILGSAQVRIERDGDIWVASGDYKREPDPSCEPFEVVRCNTFITEATFGTPSYVWKREVDHGQAIADWWHRNAERGVNSILFGYSLGKAQRILALLEPHARKPVYIHDAIEELNAVYRAEGRKLAPTRLIPEAEPLRGELILASPTILDDDERFGEYETAFASGWMIKGPNPYAPNSHDTGFTLSDHADWNDLNQTIDETGATNVFVQHRNGALIRHLRKRGLNAHPVSVLTAAKYASLPGQNLSLYSPNA